MAPYRVLVALSAIAATSASASPYATPVHPPTGSNVDVARPPHPPTAAEKGLNLDYEARSKALQAEMVVLKKADGGKLTREHRAYLRQKAEALLMLYNRDLALLERQ